MAAFERIQSGIPEMDQALDNIRLGDNVVWQVTNLEEFRYFVNPFVKQALADKRNLIYIRFASHEPFVEKQEGVKVYEVELSHKFETFTATIHHIIEKEGYDAFYVFDCLSELQVAWSTDLMMGNFFKVTCPFLFQLDTVAFFPIIRGRHSYQAIAKIWETTQLLLDVYGEEELYVHPLKVWNRYTPTMFMPYLYKPESGEFRAVTDGVDMSRYYAVLNKNQNLEEVETDSWDRFFHMAKLQKAAGVLPREALHTMCRIMMTRDERLRELVEEYFEAEDYFEIRNRMIGTGTIGGKASGMLLARKIIEKKLPQVKAKMEPHDSFFIGADVFYTFIVENNCWDLRIRQRTQEGYFQVAQEFQNAILEGHFPEDIREKFRRMLDYFGTCPIIVRSSSILEDGFGNAFAGKYDSYFCVNGGTAEERLEALEEAVKKVYASTLNPSALEYRKIRNLQEKDEQMAILVQRVSGSYFDHLFMPYAAGVGYSYSMYRFMQEMDPAAGMLRIVAGLGTKAVDRTQGDYPRLISMDKPLAFARPDVADRHRYSQRKLDVLDLEKNELTEVSMEEVLPLMSKVYKKNLLEHDTDAERRLREQGHYREVYFISCQGLARNQVFTDTMKEMLAVLEKVYGTAVDIEYTVNLGEDDDFVVNLLQCRPLQVCVGGKKVDIPQIPKERTLLHIEHSTMGRSRAEEVQVLVKVDAYAYYSYPYANKPSVARAIGKINAHFKEQGKGMVLLVPGRIGTSSPELGVPVAFADISGFQAIFEVAYSQVGYMPELSYGSHMFQDLVESDIFYGAVFENEKRKLYQPELMDKLPNHFLEICPEYEELKDMIEVCILEEGSRLYYDIESEQAVLQI